MSRSQQLGTDFTTGSIPKKMLAFSIPYIFASALQVVYSLVDMIVVGRFVGSAALSAVSISSQFVMFLTMICMAYSGGGQVYLSQLLGSGRRDGLNSAIGTLSTVLLLLSVILTAASLLLRDWVLHLLNTPPEAYELAMDYFVICTGGLFFCYGYNLVASLLRGIGESKKPLLFIAIATVVNLVLDLLFVAVFHWGTAGAAWATVIGQAVSFIYSVFFLIRRKEQLGFDFKARSFRIEKKALSEISKIGIVMVTQYCLVGISMMFVNSLVNKHGVFASAAFGVGMKLDDLITKITFGIGTACTTMLAQNYAAGDLKRVKKTLYTAWLYIGICFAVFSVLYAFFNRGMFSMFTDDPNVIALAPTYVTAAIIGFPGYIIMRGTNGLIQGTGNARLGFACGIIDAVFLRIGMAWLLGGPLGLGLFGFFLGYCTAPYGTAIPGLIYYWSGKWKNRRLMVD